MLLCGRRPFSAIQLGGGGGGVSVGCDSPVGTGLTVTAPSLATSLISYDPHFSHVTIASPHVWYFLISARMYLFTDMHWHLLTSYIPPLAPAPYWITTRDTSRSQQ